MATYASADSEMTRPPEHTTLDLVHHAMPVVHRAGDSGKSMAGIKTMELNNIVGWLWLACWLCWCCGSGYRMRAISGGLTVWIKITNRKVTEMKTGITALVLGVVTVLFLVVFVMHAVPARTRGRTNYIRQGVRWCVGLWPYLDLSVCAGSQY